MNNFQEDLKSKIEYVYKEAVSLGLNRNQRFTNFYRLLNAIPEDKEIFKLIVEMIEIEKMRNLEDPDPFRATSPIAPAFKGNILLGTVPPNSIPYFIEPESFLTHFLICGRSGSGKTNTILLILTQLLEMKKDD